ncbi:glycosyltransferase [Pelagibius marinus]|uniref:glycosyltransferase family protein n=1 Tax=Pelagibius marinus TaxID=2762760 RepID=UPI001872758E|nr:glycosyltransferase [Pelagibius marinus]
MNASPLPSRDHTGRKVLVVGNVFGRELGEDYYMIMPKLLHGFIRLGCNLHVFNDREVARGSTPFLSTGPGRRAANRKLIETARNFRPDLLLMGHCEIIENATLETLRQENPGLRIAFRNVDTLTDAANRGRLLRRADSVDAIFVTTAAPIHGVAPDRRAKVYFMPNPVDPAIDIGRAFAHSDQDFDLFFAVSPGGDARVQFLQQALERLPALKADIRGLPGSPPLRGAAFLEAMNNARMGFNMSRPDNVYLYASDRMSQLLGNGLLTFVSRSTGFQDLFSEDQIAFFDGLEELVDKLDHFARQDARRRSVAEAGWRAAHSMFASHRVAKYILERSFAQPPSESYPWPTENTEPAADLPPQESSIA